MKNLRLSSSRSQRNARAASRGGTSPSARSHHGCFTSAQRRQRDPPRRLQPHRRSGDETANSQGSSADSAWSARSSVGHRGVSSAPTCLTEITCGGVPGHCPPWAAAGTSPRASSRLRALLGLRRAPDIPQRPDRHLGSGHRSRWPPPTHTGSTPIPIRRVSMSWERLFAHLVVPGRPLHRPALQGHTRMQHLDLRRTTAQPSAPPTATTTSSKPSRLAERASPLIQQCHAERPCPGTSSSCDGTPRSTTAWCCGC